MVLGLAFKLGAVPAHAWVPDVADGAPAPVAAFLTVAPKVGALIAISRLMFTLPEEQVGWRLLVAVLAAATMTLGNLAALWQDDVRRLLGWSAVSQSGYGLMAVVALGRSELAIPSLLFFLVAYAVANLAAFGVVVELRGRADRATYAGLATAQPLLALVLVVSVLSLVGVPPLAGFTAKLALFGAAIDAGYTWLAILAVANTVVSLAYYLRVIAPSYFEPLAAPVPDPRQLGAGRHPALRRRRRHARHPRRPRPRPLRHQPPPPGLNRVSAGSRQVRRSRPRWPERRIRQSGSHPSRLSAALRPWPERTPGRHRSG